ncbi:isoprenyl transferase [Fibrivirga algicola]|uniref:Isoprenyl transferase n=1 Tax=Fibrivirga algicola TaxID=2950420 RepID=A0ABX0QQH6_9BACT|nr:isoprenyl transferase [Fibrivirga algicola]ARK11243.1 isoprenyl transferase [Fibrella sp. ES10-3-2-2]NID13112.1 isoprenyl transferase [Fibrivirga algicola]
MKDHIDPGNLPQHIAVIMDGNGRWAKQQGAARVFGHRSAIKAVREVTEGCAELGVKYLTLYAFSTENWNRPKFEVDALMTLLVHTIRGEIKTLMNNNVRLSTIGHTESLPTDCQRELQEAMRATEGNTGLTLILALSYSGRWEILEAVRQLTADIQKGKFQPSDIDEGLFSSYLNTGGVPDPELMIRTSGEMRISNFMLWQLAYSEFYMPDVLWPDFRKPHLWEAILTYQKRERRFGKTSEQVVK